jgi:hypothetical protein
LTKFSIRTAIMGQKVKVIAGASQSQSPGVAWNCHNLGPGLACKNLDSRRRPDCLIWMSSLAHRAVTALVWGIGLALTAMPGVRADDLPTKAPESVIAEVKAERAKKEKALEAEPKNAALRQQLGEILCDLGANGDESAADSAVKLFKALHDEQPKDAEILADYGNSCTIYAQYASIFTKLSWVHDGFNSMDAAVKAEPDNVGARVVRALNASLVPAFLDREKTARDDFSWLLLRIQSNPKEFSPDTLRTIYYYDGIFSLKHAEAACVQLLTQAAAIPPPPGDRLASRIELSLKAAQAKFASAQISKAS